MARRRRGNDEGTVYQDKNGVWWAQLPPDEHGKRPKRRAKTQREALEKLRQMQKDRKAGLDLTAKQPTMDAFMQTWLDQVIKPKVVAHTHESYSAVNRLYIVPHLGAIRLDKLTPARVQSWLNALLADYAPRTVQYARGILCEALDTAVTWGYVTRNVARLVDPPQVERREINPFTPDEALLLLDAVAEHRLSALYHVAIFLGLRRGELLGLRWADVDWTNKTTRIAQTVVQRDKGGPEVKGTKNDASTALLPLLPNIEEVLRKHWDNQQEERKLLGVRWKEHGLVFASEVGTPIGPRNLVRMFKESLERAGLRDIRFHDLRHTCASLLIRLNVHPKIISAILRHSSIQITMDIYGHAADESLREGLEQLSELLKSKEG